MSGVRSNNRLLGALVGLGWGAFWGLIIPLTPLISLDRQSRDWLARFQVQSPVPKEVVILGIDGQIRGHRPPDFYLEPASYAALLKRLLTAAKAKVVLLTLPNSFSKLGNPDDQYDRPLHDAIARYDRQVVLEAVPFNNRQVDTFNNLLPYGDDLQLKVPLDDLIGVRQFLVDPDNIVRRTQVAVNLNRLDGGGLQSFFSADFLAVRKFLGYSPHAPGANDRIHFFGPDRTFSEYPVELLCPPDPFEGCGPLPDKTVLDRFRGKLVIVGHVDDHPEATTVETPFGSMDALDLHANIVGDLLTGQSDRTLPPPWDLLLVLGFGMVSGLCFTLKPARILVSGLLVAFALLVFVCLRSEPTLLLPVMPMLAAFVFAGNTLFYLRSRAATQARFLAQQEEINRLRRAEREAILNQTKKLLFRVATDIHDRPLQEMKLVMDKLEDLLLGLPGQSPEAQAIDEAILALQAVGRDIRIELNDLREVAAKLEITPALKDGLHAGLHAELDRLRDSGELKLAIERRIRPLIEPAADSRWLDAREDLFRFFKEALTNVIRHAQPHGAALLWVELGQSDSEAYLIVENDGPSPGTATTGGGYGTKVMNTIAGELTGGDWQRVARPEGGTRVLLRWQMPTSTQTGQATAAAKSVGSSLPVD
ncbi:CHASE2 domain-containing protein [Gloeobacter kilaueensis]|nr:CHASE2 domain-containing protein [Gloeobacter kilaueensis]